MDGQRTIHSRNQVGRRIRCRASPNDPHREKAIRERFILALGFPFGKSAVKIPPFYGQLATTIFSLLNNHILKSVFRVLLVLCRKLCVRVPAAAEQGERVS